MIVIEKLDVDEDAVETVRQADGVTSVSIAYLRDSSGLVIASPNGSTWTVDTRTDTWTDRACRMAGRNLTGDEWAQFFPSRPYRVTCPQWPTGA